MWKVIEFQKPRFAATIEAAVGLNLIACVWRTGGAAQLLAQVLQTPFDLLPMGRVMDQPAGFEEDLARTRRRAPFRSLPRQFQLQFTQLVSVFGVLPAILWIKRDEIGC